MRQAGILMHISSLPNKYGIGTLGKEAYKFIDFLSNCGQKIWQILPIGPTSYGDSPYSALSAFAGNPYFIDLELLVKDKLLTKEELPKIIISERVDYSNLFNNRYKYLHLAYIRKELVLNEFTKFKEDNAWWVDQYALFMTLKHEHENKPWYLWYDDFKYQVDHAIIWAKNEFKDKIEEYKFYQFLFFRQWTKLRNYANKKGIKIMGDMPIYCAYDSADVWSEPKNFQLKPDLTPTFVAGCPPDGFTADGQLWGNPLYNYELMKENHYSWWVKRVKHSQVLFDIVRIDHFRGFAGYYAIPYGDTNARGGHWEVGPGYQLFKSIKKNCPNAEVVAENLGFLTNDVSRLLKKCEYPGMIIAQFELGDGKKVPLRDKTYNQNNYIYTGTHDNQTILSFYHELNKDYKKIVDELMGINYPTSPNLKFIEFCMNSVCDTCIIPIQDYIGFTDSEGRMNIPSTCQNNWTYRFDFKWLTKDLEAYIKNLTIKTNRN